ncbi:MAG: FAD-binding oxidoreductase [archaeon]|nr:FAD-binding oxidoreductase [archaeon]
MDKEKILNTLKSIVGSSFASNNAEELYIYSQDPGASKPRNVDFVVMPKNTEEVQKIVLFANKKKIPIIPMGGGLTLSGLVIPVKGGIVIDLKRMDQILEINEFGRFALLEAGVTTGKLFATLNKKHPDLQFSIPDAPTSVTVAGNALIHGQGCLAQIVGHNGNIINGLEVVLPTGDICKVGSCSVSDYWFSRGPIPDLIGLFTSSFGTMGIVTKISIKLYPKPKFRKLFAVMMDKAEKIPSFISIVTQSQLSEDIFIAVADKPEMMKGFYTGLIYFSGETEDEVKNKFKKLRKIIRKAKASKMNLPPHMIELFTERPQFGAAPADFRKGGGFEYVGSFLPIEKIPEAMQKCRVISEKYGIPPTQLCRVIGYGHAVMFAASYSFNRADPDDIKNARKALHETNKAVVKVGGIPWKTELDGQKILVEKMDPGYKKLFKNIRNLMDPNGIMNPGNWEV